jgi:hypothetical protein
VYGTHCWRNLIDVGNVHFEHVCAANQVLSNLHDHLVHFLLSVFAGPIRFLLFYRSLRSHTMV